MGRRALPKIDPKIQLQDHLFVVEDLDGEFLPKSFFDSEQPLVLEVGSGKGLFLRNAAQYRSDVNFIGIEIAKKYAQYCAYQLARRDLANAIMFQGDGQRFVQQHAAENSFHEVHVYFPDPWWKARHRKRRVLNESMLKGIEKILRQGGEFHFWTDVQEYFDVTLELIPEVTTFQGPLEVDEATPEHDMDYRTHFERRKRQADKPIYRSLFLKPESNSC